jgi:hypothetical protein
MALALNKCTGRTIEASRSGYRFPDGPSFASS